MPNFPSTPSSLSLDFLTSHLPLEKINHFTLEEIETTQSGICSTTRKIIITQESMEKISFLGKWLGDDSERNGILDEFQLFKREVFFYSEIAPGCMGTIPEVYFSEYDQETKSFFILMDFVQGEVGDCVDGCGFESARMIVESAALVHASFWESEMFDGEWGWLMDEERNLKIKEHIRSGLEGGVEYVLENEELGEEIVRFVNHYRDNFDQFWELAHKDKPRTIIHGDFHLNNMIFYDLDVYLVDWQFASISHPLYDIFYALVYCMRNCTEDQERMLLFWYHETLAGLGVDYDLQNIIIDYELLFLSFFGKSAELGLTEITEDMSPNEVRIAELRKAWYSRYMSRLKRTKVTLS